MSACTALVWIRRDLRLNDHHALYQALQAHQKVQLVFLFDPNIINELPVDDHRISFIYQQLQGINAELLAHQAALAVYFEDPQQFFTLVKTRFPQLEAVYTNRDYEPSAIERDDAVQLALAGNGVHFHSFKDQALFERDEIVKDDGTPYKVFTPYRRRWEARYAQKEWQTYPSERYLDRLCADGDGLKSLQFYGFRTSEIPAPAADVDEAVMRHYDQTRDFPAHPAGTTKLGVHLRFGTISIRALAQQAAELNDTYLSELIWREFFMQILWHFPHIVHRSFKPAYDAIPWINDEQQFQKWCDGQTGYPIVDAGMRELKATGYMHNRVRMIVASFLCKHLLIDWRWGEAHFAEHLFDFDLSANVGNWQWAAGCGVDAAPYFRVFNPSAQVLKFDAQMEYVNRWVPELNSLDYPQPMVDHATARQRAIDTYKKTLDAQK